MKTNADVDTTEEKLDIQYLVTQIKCKQHKPLTSYTNLFADTA